MWLAHWCSSCNPFSRDCLPAHSSEHEDDCKLQEWYDFVFSLTISSFTQTAPTVTTWTNAQMLLYKCTFTAAVSAYSRHTNDASLPFVLLEGLCTPLRAICGLYGKDVLSWSPSVCLAPSLLLLCINLPDAGAEIEGKKYALKLLMSSKLDIVTMQTCTVTIYLAEWLIVISRIEILWFVGAQLSQEIDDEWFNSRLD